jgi:hypothetical protein
MLPNYKLQKLLEEINLEQQYSLEFVSEYNVE